jgi:hypothetical protein
LSFSNDAWSKSLDARDPEEDEYELDMDEFLEQDPTNENVSATDELDFALSSG